MRTLKEIKKDYEDREEYLDQNPSQEPSKLYYTVRGQYNTMKDIIKLIDEKLKENPYPEDIFPKMDKETLQTIHSLLGRKLNIPLDRLASHISRLVMNNKLQELKTKIEGGKE